MKPVRRGPGRRAAGAALLAALLLAVPPAAGAARAGPCDVAGFPRPCTVAGGVYAAALPAAEGPFPAVVFLHGFRADAEEVARSPLFRLAIVERGYALIVPEPATRRFAEGPAPGWALRHERQGGRDDAAFIAEVLADAVRRFPIDRERVLVAGHSRGGLMVWELACHGPELAAGFAVVAGGYLGPLPARCTGPVRFLATHGRADSTVPLAGRARASAGLPLAPLAAALAALARGADCAGDLAAGGDVPGFTHRRWTGCPAGAQIDLLLHDGGHELPGTWPRAALHWFEAAPAPPPAPRARRLRPGTRSPAAADRFRRPPSASAR